ncbi:uncharacterized protein LOC136036525 [Artemia franciscana]|uniref:uncharacterized protein LOC136036525 n=1 Tax=Artemia franciscana TaxID=6661 RepID=UPI0032DB1574
MIILVNDNVVVTMTWERQLQIFRPFFVQLNLPYSVIRGEAVSIQVVVFNYMSRDQNAAVVLESSGDDFEFIGETIYKNKAVLIDLRQRSLFNESISIEIPPYAVPGSEHIEVDAIADIMGPSINNPTLLPKFKGI